MHGNCIDIENNTHLLLIEFKLFFKVSCKVRLGLLLP